MGEVREVASGAAPRNGTVKETTIRQRMIGGKVDPVDEVEDRLSKLFAELGGGGRVKCYRVIAGKPTPVWCGSFEATQEFCDAVEETVAQTYGAGDYELRASPLKASGGHAITARISIDEKAVPKGAAAAAAAPPAPVVQSIATTGEPSWFEKQMIEERRLEREARRDAEGRADRASADARAAQAAMVSTLITALASSHSAQLHAVAAPAAPAAGNGNMWEELRKSASFFKEVGAFKDGTELAGSDPRGIGERLVEKPLTRLCEVIGEKVIDRMMPDEKKAAEKKAAEATTPERSLPPPPKNPQLPAGARPLSLEDVEKIRRGEVKPQTAPKAKDADPSAVTEKK